MGKITLDSTNAVNSTVISNIFIDSYMPSANGSYVKVYLYLLRCLSCERTDFSISYLADRLEDTEKDIVRALRYWEKVQLLEVTNDNSGNISSIIIIDPVAAEKPKVPVTIAMPQVSPSAAPISAEQRPVYTTAQISDLTSNDEVKWIMNIIELYLERPLKPTDIQLILYLYESVGFSPELIMYLYEYCISKSKKNASYIEAVALSWAEQGITTVNEAEAANTCYNSNYAAVNKAFGLNRTPGTAEKTYIDKWLTKYGLGIDIIVEACNRTIINTQKADFKYADKILENWSRNNVKTLPDIKKLDTQFNAVKNASQSAKTVRDTPQKPSNNRFNAFPQRNYSKEDYEDIEKRLLNRQ